MIFNVAIGMIPTALAQVGGTSDTQSGGGGTSDSPDNNSSGTFTLQNPLSSKIDSVGGLVKSFIEIFSYVAILFAVLVLVYIGFSYILASAKGNAAEIEKLHTWLWWTIVGVAVVISARVIVEIVINTLNATGTISPGVFNSTSNALQK